MHARCMGARLHRCKRTNEVCKTSPADFARSNRRHGTCCGGVSRAWRSPALLEFVVLPGHCVCSLQAPDVASRWRALLFDSCCVLRACLASQPLRHVRVGVLFLVQLRAQLDDSEGEEHTVEGESLEGQYIESMPPAIGNDALGFFAARRCRARTDERGRSHGC